VAGILVDDYVTPYHVKAIADDPYRFAVNARHILLMTCEKLKYCHCRDTCNRLLSRRQRDRHYAQLSEEDKQARGRSVSPDHVDTDEELEGPVVDIWIAQSDDRDMESEKSDLDGDALQENCSADEEMGSISDGGNEMDVLDSPEPQQSDDDSVDVQPEFSVDDDWLSYHENEELDAEEEYSLFEKILESEQELFEERKR